MVTLFFWYKDATGKQAEASLGAIDLETCFDMLSELVMLGMQPQFIKLLYEPLTTYTMLPDEAFDGQPMTRYIRQLQAEWEAILC